MYTQYTVGLQFLFRGKDFYWSPTRRRLDGDQQSFPWVYEIFPSCPLTGVRSFISYATIIINIPSDRNKDISYATIIIYIPSDRYKDISYATIIINIPSDRNKDISM